MIEMPLEATRRPRKRSIDIAFSDLKLTDRIGSILLMEDHAPRRERLLGVDHSRQRLKIDGDELGSVFRQIAAFRQNDRNGLPDVTHLVMG